MNNKPNPKSRAQDLETAQADSESITQKFNEIMNTPSPNCRYGGKILIELVPQLLRPKQPLNESQNPALLV